jgi:hypothetical protein
MIQATIRHVADVVVAVASFEEEMGSVLGVVVVVDH